MAESAHDRELFEAQHGMNRLELVFSRGEVARVVSEFDQVLAVYADLGVGRSYLDSALPYMHGIIARFQGTTADFAPVLDQMSTDYPQVAWASAHALALAAAGRTDEAIAKIDDSIADDLGTGAMSFSHALVVLTEAAIVCGHLDPLPYLRSHMEVWPQFLAAHSWGCWGGGWQALGWISAALGERDRARDEYHGAIEQYAAAGMCGYHAWATQDLAELEAADGHADLARRLATEARTEAESLGCHAVTRRAEMLLVR